MAYNKYEYLFKLFIINILNRQEWEISICTRICTGIIQFVSYSNERIYIFSAVYICTDNLCLQQKLNN